MSPLYPDQDATLHPTPAPAVLICIEGGVGINAGDRFPVLGENGHYWEVLVGATYCKINKRSGRVTGWKTPPKFALKGE